MEKFDYRQAINLAPITVNRLLSCCQSLHNPDPVHGEAINKLIRVSAACQKQARQRKNCLEMDISVEKVRSSKLPRSLFLETPISEEDDSHLRFYRGQMTQADTAAEDSGNSQDV